MGGSVAPSCVASTRYQRRLCCMRADSFFQALGSRALVSVGQVSADVGAYSDFESSPT